MSNKIIYWPHKDRESPLPYIRIREESIQGTKNRLVEILDSHENIKQTLFDWFDSTNPDSVFSQLSERFDLDDQSPVKISFINYGNTELVYLAKVWDKNKFTILINQPHTSTETIKQEFENLKRLYEIDPRYVVEPLAYFANERKEYSFYVTEYIDNAICIAHNPGWTAWFYNPLPYYHFENINLGTTKELNKNIIALLVNYYDEEQWMWLSETEISGNDFILTRDFNVDNLETVKNSIKLISARNLMKISFNEYLNLIRKEFSIWTNREMDEVLNGKIKINHKSVISMTTEEIEQGIKLWLAMSSNSI